MDWFPFSLVVSAEVLPARQSRLITVPSLDLFFSCWLCFSNSYTTPPLFSGYCTFWWCYAYHLLFLFNTLDRSARYAPAALRISVPTLKALTTFAGRGYSITSGAPNGCYRVVPVVTLFLRSFCEIPKSTFFLPVQYSYRASFIVPRAVTVIASLRSTAFLLRWSPIGLFFEIVSPEKYIKSRSPEIEKIKIQEWKYCSDK